MWTGFIWLRIGTGVFYMLKEGCFRGFSAYYWKHLKQRFPMCKHYTIWVLGEWRYGFTRSQSRHWI